MIRAALTGLMLLCAAASHAAETKGKSMSYAEARDFLSRHTRVVELCDASGARVAVCPAWQGRVMTSTCGGAQGPSFGFINSPYIEAGKVDKHFNNYGAEERMWLSPEGGPFSLWFKPGVPQALADWYTPLGLNETPWQLAGEPTATACRMGVRTTVPNASGTQFDLEIGREVRLLPADELTSLFGPAAAAIAQPGVQRVGYETINRVTNRGPAMTKEKGMVSIWILGMMNSAPRTVILVPYRQGDEASLGPAVKSDYFGPVPPERLKVLPGLILFRADGNYRAKIGVSQRRVKNVLGSIDFAANMLTLVQFTMPDDPAQAIYLNNQWGGQDEPYRGDVANSYNDGPLAPGKPGLGPFYEIESLSPARALATGETLVHHHRTVHIQADRRVLADLAAKILGADLDRVEAEMGK